MKNPIYGLVLIAFVSVMSSGCEKSENKPATVVKDDGIAKGVKVIVPGPVETSGTVELAPAGGDLVLVKTDNGEDMIAPRASLKLNTGEPKKDQKNNEPKKSD